MKYTILLIGLFLEQVALQHDGLCHSTESAVFGMAQASCAIPHLTQDKRKTDTRAKQFRPTASPNTDSGCQSTPPSCLHSSCPLSTTVGISSQNVVRWSRNVVKARLLFCFRCVRLLRISPAALLPADITNGTDGYIA